MRRFWNSLRHSDNQSGQALVESAFVVIIGILLLTGVVEFGWAYFRYLALQDAAGEGAAYGIVHPNWHDNNDNPDPNNIVYRTQHESNSSLLDWSSASVDVEAPFMTPGNLITVTVTYDHQLITPMLSPLFGNSIKLRAKAVQSAISPYPGP